MFIKKKIVFKEINFLDLSYDDIKKNIKKGGLLVISSGPVLSTLENYFDVNLYIASTVFLYPSTL